MSVKDVSMHHILDIQELSVRFGNTQAVNQISLKLPRGKTLGIVGESGSGKSVTALSIMQLLPKGAVTEGKILFQPGEDKASVNLAGLSENDLTRVRGKSISMIFQEPMTSLNPVFKCGIQVTEAIQHHKNVGFKAARSEVLHLFEQVKLPDPERIFNAFPHQISGGQKQRVMIAMAMSCQPDLIIADEPTTALDVTVQRSILELLCELKESAGLSMIFISHDLGVISEICDEVAVMYRGNLVEEGAVKDVFNHPKHAYSRGLVACRPDPDRQMKRLPTVGDFLENRTFDASVTGREEILARRQQLYSQKPLLNAEAISISYPRRKNWYGKVVDWMNAVDQVSFDIYPGETFGLAGESGCGKTTLGRTIARLAGTFTGNITYNGQQVSQLTEAQFKPFRKEIQVVFQDPYSSLNPRMTIGAAIEEPLEVHQLHGNKESRREKTIELLQTVGLQPEHYQRYPHEFSGGQRQRICLARALAPEPRFLICDEMVSALDVSVQATILNLLKDLQEQFGLTLLFISHDLGVIRQMCDRLMVMKSGRTEATGFPDELYGNPPTDYIRNLIESVPGRRL
ncbi:MAG: ABC transporter ATP-binding protein [Bacteroidota bacterium]